jgi:HK97 family phage major capsid protein
MRGNLRVVFFYEIKLKTRRNKLMETIELRNISPAQPISVPKKYWEAIVREPVTTTPLSNNAKHLYSNYSHNKIAVEPEIGAAIIVNDMESITEEALPTLIQKDIVIKRITTAVSVSKQFAFDVAFNLDEYVYDVALRRFMETIEISLINGDLGATKPDATNAIQIAGGTIGKALFLELMKNFEARFFNGAMFVMGKVEYEKFLASITEIDTWVKFGEFGFSVFGIPVKVSASMSGIVTLVNPHSFYTIILKDEIDITKIEKDTHTSSKGLVTYVVDIYAGGTATIQKACIVAPVTA